jgi:sulfur carrier protein
MAKIQLNGRKITIRSNFSIYDVLKKFRLDNKKVAIEHNGIIIPKVKYKKKYLKNNDKLEVVHFIGGG